MTTRTAVAAKALSFDGYEDGFGYDTANQFSADLARPTESWCADFTTDVFKRCGLPLPSMQPGCRTGFSYVPSGVSAAQGKTGGFVRSWQARPGDLVCFDWNADHFADHVELATSYVGSFLYTIGGNSGPSNVDRFTGQGGVHRHVWSAPVGVGNGLVLGVIDTGKFVSFGSSPAPVPPPPSSTCPYRLLMLKSPLMYGSDVRSVQEALNAHGSRLVTDGWFGQLTRDAVMGFQRSEAISVDGIVGCQTRSKLGLAA